MSEIPTTARLTAAGWCKSSYSAANNECVEVARIFRRVGIRDSKSSGQRRFTVNARAFTTFINGLKDGPAPPVP